MISSKVSMQLAKDQFIKPGQIIIHEDGENISLEGMVDSKLAYEQAIAIALNTDGVDRVNAHTLQVANFESCMNDLHLSAQIKAQCLKLKLDPTLAFNYQDLSVSVTNGQAFMKVNLRQVSDAETLKSIASQFEGIQSVIVDISLTV